MKKFALSLISIILTAAFFVTGYRYIFPSTRIMALEDIPQRLSELAESETDAQPAAQELSTAGTTAVSAATATEAETEAPAESTTVAVPATVAETAAPSETQTEAETAVKTTTEKPTETETAKSSTTEAESSSAGLSFPSLDNIFDMSIPSVTPGIRTFRQAPDDYFEDALFIGDSRTEELMEYGNLPGATFFCKVGMSLYNMHKGTVKVNNGIGSVSFDSLINNHRFRKVYIMLGVNEIGYARQQTVNKYKALIDEIKAAQPNSVIFIEANIHLTAKESAKSSEINNKEIDDFNNKISQFADKKTVFYLDVNEIFDDDSGALRSECSGDGTHLKAKYTREWGEWLKTKAIL